MTVSLIPFPPSEVIVDSSIALIAISLCLQRPAGSTCEEMEA